MAQPKAPKGLPDVVEMTTTELDAVLAELKAANLKPTTLIFVQRCLELALWIPHALQSNKISMHRLKTIVFGKGYRQKNKNEHAEDQAGNTPPPPPEAKGSTTAEKPQTTAPQETSMQADGSTDKTDTSAADSPEEKPCESPPKRSGHGRLPRSAYDPIAETVHLPSDFARGDLCPDCERGKLAHFHPGHLIRVKGQPMARVIDYVVEKHRCSRCQSVISAPIPSDVGDEKYDARFKALIVLQKYYVGTPFYRQEAFQQLLGFPLPDATQWDLVNSVGGCGYAPFNTLKALGGDGKIIYGDDTWLRILSHMATIKVDSEVRRGMYTSGFIIEIDGGHRIALFLNGTKHAGENLQDLLALRQKKCPPIHMCDASSNNIPKGFAHILCNCLSHGFRRFEELVDFFPEQCVKIMRYIKQFYEHDEQAQEKKLAAQARLAYHKKHSRPVAKQLKAYCAQLINDRIIEPNSELGQAIRYLQRHWEKLMRFLSVAGAPLDSNIIERALKCAIRLRKNSLFYKTPYSAEIGGMLTSLIYTCQLAKKNPLDYLTQLQVHQKQVQRRPKLWLPWNYEGQLSAPAPG